MLASATATARVSSASLSVLSPRSAQEVRDDERRAGVLAVDAAVQLPRGGTHVARARIDVWWWLEGREDEGYEPVLRTSPTGDNVMTWGEFVEAAYLREYRRRRVPLHRLRLFIEALRDELQLPHPLATQRPFIAAEHRLVLELEERVELAGEFRPVVVDPTDGQLVLSYLAEAFLDKVEFGDGGDMPALRWFPAGKQSPVVVDPEMSGGAPTLRGIRTEALAE